MILAAYFNYISHSENLLKMPDPFQEKYNDNLVWFKERYHILKERYKGKLCLVIDDEGEIFNDIADLLTRLKDVDMKTTVIEYIT